jgi:hypothetical protein
MARRKSSRRGHRSRRTRRVRRTRRIRRGGDGSIGAPYPASRIMPLNPNQTLDGRYFSRSNQIGGGRGGMPQPSGSIMNVGGANGQMATYGVTGGRF